MKRTQEELERMRDLVATAEKLAKNPDLIPLIGNPQEDCKKCYGRGHHGKDGASGLYLLCSCIFTGEAHWIRKTVQRKANALR